MLGFLSSTHRRQVHLTLETPLLLKLGEGELEVPLLSWERGWGEG